MGHPVPRRRRPGAGRAPRRAAARNVEMARARMKVLSLGPHEGFVELWILKQFPDAEIDAVELHPGDVAECVRRGINCVRGRAEDAYRYFEQGTYDAVVAFEL